MDNLLKALSDAISQSYNEQGGVIITRLREAHNFGRNDGSVLTASPTALTSSIDCFELGMVGYGIDILQKSSATGNEGSYVIASYVDTKNVTLNKIDGVAATFINESAVRWRFSTLRVETTFGFPTHDRDLSLWVGDERSKVPYSATDLTPGTQLFKGIGQQTLRIDGVIVVAAPQTLKTVEDFFDASMVGKAVWVLKKDTASGNEGPRRIAAVVDSKTVTLAGSAFVANESDVWLTLKTYVESGYLTKSQREDQEVIDGSRGYSTIDQLHRSFLVDYAEGEELDVLGGNLGVFRTKTMGDEIYRRYIKVRAYLPATTLHAIEMVMQAIFPQGGWSIYEDLINHPCEVFLSIPTMALGSDYEGRTFLASAGKTPIDGSTVSDHGLEKVTSTTATSVTVNQTPITVVRVEVVADSPPRRNYWNLTRNDGALAGGGAKVLSSASALFIAGDTGRTVRLYAAKDQNCGLWKATYTAASQLTLAGVPRTGATVTGKNSDLTGARVTLLDPWFIPQDAAKKIVISGSSHAVNNNTFDILQYIDERTIVVDNATGFFTDQNLNWQMADTEFQAEASIKWELIDTGSKAGAVLTLRDSLPGATTPVQVQYTDVLSAQTLRNEFVRNDGSGGTAPNIFYPFYLWDVDSETRGIFDDITAAGVIARFKRPW